MGGPGSTRWGRNIYPPRPKIDEVMRLDGWQVARSLRTGQRTVLGEIQWLPRVRWSRRGRRVREGTLVTKPQLHTRRPEYRLFVVAHDQPRNRGQRWWLVCVGCHKARRALFLRGGRALRCRVCSRLLYPTQYLTPRQRAAYKRDKIGRRIFRYWDVSTHPPDRPKGMHRARYARMLATWRAEDSSANGVTRNARPYTGAKGIPSGGVGLRGAAAVSNDSTNTARIGACVDSATVG